MANPTVNRPSDLLLAHRDEVIAITERHGGSEVLVFGSIARGEDSVGSDVDLIVTFAPGSASLADVISLEDELAAVLGVPVDVVSSGAERIAVVMRHAVAL